MAECLHSSHVSVKSDLCSNSWERQYTVLRRLVGKWVYSAHLPLWAGEEEEVISDIVQESLCRTIARMRKAEQQEATPVSSPDFLSRAIARNLFIDFIRKDKRIVPLSQMTHSSGEETFEFELADNAEDVNEDVFQESVFNALASKDSQIQPLKTERKPTFTGNQDVSDMRRDPTLVTLTAHLHKTAPVAAIDPNFRSTLKAKLLDKLRLQRSYIPLKTSLHIQNIDDASEKIQFDEISKSVLEKIWQEDLLEKVVQEIEHFPNKQKLALLVDIADHTDFEENEAMLRKAFLKVGVRLEDYLGWQPDNSIERSRFASLLSISYKRVARLANKWIEVVQ